MNAGDPLSAPDQAATDVSTPPASAGQTDSIPAADNADTIETNPHGTTASGYMLLRRTALTTAKPVFTSDFVHEFFHILEFRYNVGDCDGGHDYWFTEAAATWAESHFARATAPSEVYYRFTGKLGYAAAFQQVPGRSLLDTTNLHNYDSFIWPFFMEQQAGAGSIARAWARMAGVTSCSGMTAALNAVVPFATSFRNFTVRNLAKRLPTSATDTPAWPADSGANYRQLDGRFPEGLPRLTNDFELQDYAARSIPVRLAPLAAQYDRVTTTGNAIGLEIDTSGITANRGSLDVDVVANEFTGSEPGQIDRPYRRLKLSGNRLAICVTDDGGADTSLWPTMFVVLSNHDTDPGHTVRGSYGPAGSPQVARGLCGDG
jgi:hypothetical protein